jgi:hypothetical protein
MTAGVRSHERSKIESSEWSRARARARATPKALAWSRSARPPRTVLTGPFLNGSCSLPPSPSAPPPRRTVLPGRVAWRGTAASRLSRATIYEWRTSLRLSLFTSPCLHLPVCTHGCSALNAKCRPFSAPRRRYPRYATSPSRVMRGIVVCINMIAEAISFAPAQSPFPQALLAGPLNSSFWNYHIVCR